MNFWQRLKQHMWKELYPVFPRIEKLFLPFHEKGRQRYSVGWLAPGRTLEELKNHLHEVWGFGNHFVAWADDDQVLSWRKLTSFSQQYHLRVYNDGEIRGHFEYTPEAHPVDHFIEKGEIDKTEDFKKFLGEFVVSEKYISHLVRDVALPDPDSELTFEEEERFEKAHEKTSHE